jgi:hypothetical protein
MRCSLQTGRASCHSIPVQNWRGDVNTQSVTQEVARTGHKITGNLEVRVLRSVQEIEGIRNVWTCWNHHPNSDLDLYLLLTETRPEILGPHVIVLYRNRAPVAMLIGRIVSQRIPLKIGYKTILSPRVRLLSFVTGGMLGDLSPEGCQAALTEIVKCLREREADVVVLNNVPTDQPIYQAAKRAAGLLNRDHFPTSQVHRAMILPRSAEQLYRSLSSKSRKNLRWQAKRLLHTFPDKLRIDCFSHPRELEQMIHDVEEIACKTYQRGLGVGFTNTNEIRTRLHLDAQNGRLRAFLLYLADEPCAFWLGTVYENTFHSEWLGYDPGLSKYSPGMYLITRVIEDFCSRRYAGVIEQIDFGLGDAQYKGVLGNKEWHDATVHIFSSTLKGLGVNFVRTTVVAADKIARAFVGRMGLVSKVKSTWRKAVRAHTNRSDSRKPVE